MSVTIFRNKFAKGWPRHDEGERGYVVPLGDALERSYTTDAHFAAYSSPNRRRLTSEILDRDQRVTMTAIVFDLDCPLTHGTSTPAPEDWRRDIRDRVVAAAEEHPGVYVYETRGGSRLVWRLPSPIGIRTADHAQTWAQDYALCTAYFQRRWGLEFDGACSDWQRLYRLPRATRDKNRRPENWPVWGDPDQIGALRIAPTAADLKAAAEISKAFEQRRALKFEPYTGGGEGLFFYLLRGRGCIPANARQAGGGTVIRCPNEHDHSSGATMDGSTVYYAPAAGEQLGLVHCKHLHCVGKRARDWLRLFTDDEIQRARDSAGIPERKAA